MQVYVDASLLDLPPPPMCCFVVVPVVATPVQYGSESHASDYVVTCRRPDAPTFHALSDAYRWDDCDILVSCVC
jgi:hypothetical protein